MRPSTIAGRDVVEHRGQNSQFRIRLSRALGFGRGLRARQGEGVAED